MRREGMLVFVFHLRYPVLSCYLIPAQLAPFSSCAGDGRKEWRGPYSERGQREDQKSPIDKAGLSEQNAPDVENSVYLT